MCVFSDASTMMKQGDQLVPAQLAWEHPGWNANLTEPLDPLARWIWSACHAEDPRNGGLADFYDEFFVVGATTSAVLKIAVDNAFEAGLNETLIDTVNLTGDWRDQSVFGTAYLPDPGVSAWGVVYTYDVLGRVFSGTNELKVTGVNAAWPTDDPTVNPGGVRYQLCITSEEEIAGREAACESAWSDGCRFVKKGNWATYSTYTIQ